METFPAARAKFPILQLIDNYVVSGEEKMVKPDRAIFQVLLDRYGLRPEECLFIDDNPDNIEGARRVGLNGIVFAGAEDLRQRIASILQASTP
jgi:2-haloacid dehalogenase